MESLLKSPFQASHWKHADAQIALNKVQFVSGVSIENVFGVHISPLIKEMYRIHNKHILHGKFGYYSD